MTPRLPLLSPGQLSEEQRVLYDEIAAGPRARGPQLFELVDSQGRLNGPFNAMLFSPPVGELCRLSGQRCATGRA